MAKTGGSRSRQGRDAAARRRAKPRATPPGAKKPDAKKPDAKRSGTKKPAVPETPSEQPRDASPFRLGVIPGATPGKWIDAWHDRMPHTPLELVPLAVADQRRALVSGAVDVALVRLPLDADGLHVIPLYDEVPVVVTSSDSHLTAADELTIDDLAGEVLITPGDDVLDADVPGAVPASFAPPHDTEEAIAIAATGVGIVVVPMSLARLHHRKDAAHRPLRDGPTSTVALAWIAERTTSSVETFVGIVRGRTAHSSRT